MYEEEKQLREGRYNRHGMLVGKRYRTEQNRRLYRQHIKLLSRHPYLKHHTIFADFDLFCSKMNGRYDINDACRSDVITSETVNSWDDVAIVPAGIYSIYKYMKEFRDSPSVELKRLKWQPNIYVTRVPKVDIMTLIRYGFTPKRVERTGKFLNNPDIYIAIRSPEDRSLKEEISKVGMMVERKVKEVLRVIKQDEEGDLYSTVHIIEQILGDLLELFLSRITDFDPKNLIFPEKD